MFSLGKLNLLRLLKGTDIKTGVLCSGLVGAISLL